MGDAPGARHGAYCVKSLSEWQGASMFMVRYSGSQSVALRLGSLQMLRRLLPSGRLPVPFTLVGTQPWPHGSFVVHGGRSPPPVQLNSGCTTCPVCPSHSSHEMSQPLLKKKQAWPLLPVSLRGSLASLSGCAHQNMKGILSTLGTVLFHGCTLPSIALRGLGIVTAPWPAAVETSPARASERWTIISSYAHEEHVQAGPS